MVKRIVLEQINYLTIRKPQLGSSNQLNYLQNQFLGDTRLICFADFRQLPPITKLQNNNFFNSHLVRNFKIANLTTIHRQKATDAYFINLIRNVGLGHYTNELRKFLAEKQIVYQKLPLKEKAKITHSYSSNPNVKKFNQQCMANFNSKIHKFTSKITGIFRSVKHEPSGEDCVVVTKFDPDDNTYKRLYQVADYTLDLEEIQIPTIVEGIKIYQIPSQQHFRVGYRIMITRNIYEFNETTKMSILTYANGTMGIITEINSHKMTIKIDGDDNKLHEIHHKSYRISMKTDLGIRSPVHRIITKDYVMIKYFPVTIAFAITIHKSQGMTLHKAAVSLTGLFASGLGYVALSRLSTPDGLYVVNFDQSVCKTSREVQNFYKWIDAGGNWNKYELAPKHAPSQSLSNPPPHTNDCEIIKTAKLIVKKISCVSLEPGFFQLTIDGESWVVEGKRNDVKRKAREKLEHIIHNLNHAVVDTDKLISELVKSITIKRKKY